MASDFVHLHLHSEYSLLDGACRISEIPAAAKAAGHSAVAITDHGVMYGAVEFYKACKEAAIKPIIGCEVYVARRTMNDRDRYLDLPSYHLILLVKNETGYRNLTVLTSHAFTDGFYSKPRIDLDLLREHTDGLIALSACLAGFIPRAIVAGDYDSAREHALMMDGLFGRGNYYLELQDHGIADQRVVNEGIRSISESTGIPMVATNDIHYLKRSDAESQATLLCIQTNNVITDGRPVGFETDEFYYKSTEEMSALFADYPGAIENSVKIAESCTFDFEFGHTHLPAYRPESGEAPSAFLRRLTEMGLKKRIRDRHITYSADRSEADYRERIDYELSVIQKMGYPEYYLIVWDFVNYAKSHGLPVGPGRGSGAGSLVAYLIGITDIDPLRFDLLFERFLNPERVSMPDFDIDFCYDRRDEVIAYVKEKYGEDHAVQIITFGTLAARAAVRDVGRALGMPYADVDRVAKLIPQSPGMTLKRAMDERRELSQMYNSNSAVHHLIDVAASLEGMPRHSSTHAAGVVITDRPITSYVPIATSGGAVVTQYGMDTIAELGLLKFDFLALRYLTIIDHAERAVRERDPGFDLSSVDISDIDTYRLISEGRTDGVFQLESRGMRQMLMQLKPRSIDDIIAAIALYRPGPMDSIPRYVKARADGGKVAYDIPELAPILDSTYGCIVYQEQVMQIFRTVAGYSFGHADIVRRAISKKKSEVLECERDSFIDGAEERGTPRDLASALFDEIVSFANYAFNKSHAAAYAVLSFRTAYLKAHYPSEYYAALLTSVFGSADKIAEYTAECHRIGVRILPPDVNRSRRDFSVEGTDVRYGLLALKNVGVQFIDTLVDEREKLGAFDDFDDFVTRMRHHDMNRRQLESLIKSGSMDSLGAKRSQMLAVYESVMDSDPRGANEEQFDMFQSAGASMPEAEHHTKFPDIPEFTSRERLRLERESSGVYLSGHILDDYRRSTDAQGMLTVASIKEAVSEQPDSSASPELGDRSRVHICGAVTNRVQKNTRSGGRLLFITIEDRTGEIELICFSKAAEQYGYLLMPNAVVSVFGSISLKDEGEVKIILESAEVLQPDEELPPDMPSDTASDNTVGSSITQPGTAKPRTLYVRVSSEDARLLSRVTSFLQIFEGGVRTVIFDPATKREMRLSCAVDDFLVNELIHIIGRKNVVLK